MTAPPARRAPMMHISALASSSETGPSRIGERERWTAQPSAGPALTRPLLEIAAASPSSPAWSVLLRSRSLVRCGEDCRSAPPLAMQEFGPTRANRRRVPVSGHVGVRSDRGALHGRSPVRLWAGLPMHLCSARAATAAYGGAGHGERGFAGWAGLDVRLAKVVACGDSRGHVAALVVRVAADCRAAMRLQTVLRLRWLCS
jgi:hypothetical protein